jgi:hypothetical protein
MRLQLIRFLCACVVLLLAWPAEAQVVHIDTTHTFFYEAPTRTNMFVYTPAVDGRAAPWEWLDVHAGWEADIVSGASVSVKAGPAYKATQPAADVISTASVTDFRNVASGGFTIKKDTVSVDGGYLYSTENDYKSHTFNVAARTELFEHNTIFQLDYAHNFDLVCDRTQGANDTFSRYVAMESSKGCWSGATDPNRPLRVTHDLAIDSAQASWSQAWTPIFQSQLVYTLQLANGFQSNPYRSIILGQGVKAQEHHPDNRARHAIALRGALYLKPIKAAARVGLRGYWDTWNVASGSFEAEFEKYIGERLRVNVRGRFYKQTGALFWSDDYTGGDKPLGPKGQYWTGDRELSPFFSGLVGLRVSYVMTPQQDRKILGFMQEVKISASLDVLQFWYESYTLPAPPPKPGEMAGDGSLSNTRAFIGGGNVGFAF